ITLFATGSVDLLGSLSKPIVTSQGTFDALQALFSEHTGAAEGPQLSATLDGDRLVFVERTAEQRQHDVEQVRSFLNAVQERIEVIACPALARWDPERRQLLSKFYGWGGVEVIAL